MRVLKPSYTTQAKIWVEKVDQRSGGRADASGPISAAQLFASDGWVDLFKSFAVLDEAVADLRLYITPESPADHELFRSLTIDSVIRPGSYTLTVDATGQNIALSTPEGQPLDRVAVGDSIGRPLGIKWLPDRAQLRPGRVANFRLSTPRNAAQQLATRLRISQDRNGNFLTVEFGGPNPRRIAETVNTVVDRYIEVAGELKRQKLTERKGILEEQLERAQRNLTSAELALSNFRVQTITEPSETPMAAGLTATTDPVTDRFFEMKLEQEELRQDRLAIQRALASADSAPGAAIDRLEVIESVQNNGALGGALGELTDMESTLRALQYKYTDEHPAVQRQREDIERLRTRSIPALARSLIGDIEAREADLRVRVGSTSEELRRIPPRALREAQLTRDVEVAVDLFTKLQSGFEEAQLAEASSIPDVRVLDRAVVPERPSKNRGPQVLIVGMVAGLALGVLAALVLDRFDRRVRYPEQVTTEMGLPILGVVPFMKPSRNGLRSKEVAPVLEALRGIRLNLIHAYGTAGPLLITVTSPGSGDGKSFVASNLALAFADAGHRTLLIDGDVRRGALHRVLGTQRKPGLTDVLAGKAPRDEAVQTTGYNALDFIGCGTRLSGAPELLGSSAMAQLVTSLRARYGVIVVDSPPLGAGVDAFAIGTVTGNAVIVLRTGSTDRELAEAKLDILDRLPIRIVGAVLNGVRENNVYRYYSYYLPGYEYEEEDEGEPKLLNRVG
jgi:capsular exopolysaccharide synthesis family protein